MARWVLKRTHRAEPARLSSRFAADRQVRLSRIALVSWALLMSLGCETRRVTIPLMPPFLPSAKPLVFWTEGFETLDPARWRQVRVKRETQYDLVTLDARSCLRATSRNGASIFLSAVRFDPETYEWFSWDWRVDQLVEGEALDRKGGSDAAARVYVYFASKGLPWRKRNLDYVWSASLPVGTLLDSAYSSTSKMIVVESGSGSLGQWRTVERNLEEDFERAFGKQDLPDVIAIGVMSDTDNTGGEALAYFDELRISRRSAAQQERERRRVNAGPPLTRSNGEGSTAP